MGPVRDDVGDLGGVVAPVAIVGVTDAVLDRDPAPEPCLDVDAVVVEAGEDHRVGAGVVGVAVEHELQLVVVDSAARRDRGSVEIASAS
jgi:hypothetical protein